MLKEQALSRWQELPDSLPLKPQVIPYKHEGSTYDCDSVRITGSQAFIDSVLSRLKDLLEFEGQFTRLQLVYAEATDKERREATGTYACYVQVHERGPQAQMVNAVFGIGKSKRGNAATSRKRTEKPSRALSGTATLALPAPKPNPDDEPLDRMQRAVLRKLCEASEPVQFDALVESLGIGVTPGQVASALIFLEMQRMARQYPGKRFWKKD